MGKGTNSNGLGSIIAVERNSGKRYPQGSWHTSAGKMITPAGQAFDVRTGADESARWMQGPHAVDTPHLRGWPDYTGP